MSSLLEVFQPSADPLGSQWLSALVAVIPIVCMLVTLGALRWKAHIAGAVSWALAFVVAILAFKMPVTMAVSSSFQGFVYGLFPIVWILLMAIWMYQVTVISGRFEDLRNTFFLISDDPRVLGLLIAFCFGGLLEALAGFDAYIIVTPEYNHSIPGALKNAIDFITPSVLAGKAVGLVGYSYSAGHRPIEHLRSILANFTTGVVGAQGNLHLATVFF